MRGRYYSLEALVRKDSQEQVMRGSHIHGNVHAGGGLAQPSPAFQQENSGDELYSNCTFVHTSNKLVWFHNSIHSYLPTF